MRRGTRSSLTGAHVFAAALRWIAPSRRPNTRCGTSPNAGSLAKEITAHDRLLDEITATAAPRLREGFGIGPDTAATMFTVFGDNPRENPVRGSLCEALRRVPDPRFTRHEYQSPPSQPRRSPPCERCSVSHRHRAHALPSAVHRLHAQTYGARTSESRSRPLPEILPHPRNLPTGHCQPPPPSLMMSRHLDRQSCNERVRQRPLHGRKYPSGHANPGDETSGESEES